MIEVGITGHSGFIGSHLINSLRLDTINFNIIPFSKDFFLNISKLKVFVKKCDVIIHLAAINRDHSQERLYENNILLINNLISACDETNSKPHIIFSSSLQEKDNNFYGNSKKDGRKILEKWATLNNVKLTSLIIPNVFGPFGKPFYNSVVSTFCYQLTHNEVPKIDIDKETKFIYVGELLDIVKNKIINQKSLINKVKIPYTLLIKISLLLKKLKKFKNDYLLKGDIPNIRNSNDLNLFSTFLSYIDHKKFFPVFHKINSDDRGSFVEIIKLISGGQVSYSSTLPSITRGNHFHTKKIERFSVIKGKALIKLRRIGTDNVIEFRLDGLHPSYIDIPIWFTHNIKNIGKTDLITLFWINKSYNLKDSDTYYEEV